MNAIEAFSQDYFSARKRFRQAVADRGGEHSCVPVGDADLTIDLGRFGPHDASQLLILSSGLHGVEGLFGSAVQLAWLHSPEFPLKQLEQKSLGVLLIHGLNPHGFVHRRRFNEDNIDLNRNFLSPDQFEAFAEESRTSLYAKLDPWLNPPSPPGRCDGFALMAFWLLLRYGREKLRQVLPVGQYAFPRGLFFGGSSPAFTTRWVMEHSREWIGDAERVLHLDWHTGLGDWGVAKLLANLEGGDARIARLRAWFGSMIETPEGPTAYRARGDMGEWLMNRHADRNYHFLTAEFGTYPNTHTLKMLRRENRAHHFAVGDPEKLESIKSSLLEAFVPKSIEWRTNVIQTSLEITQEGLNKWAA